VPERGTSPERIPVGEVVGAHGVRGLLRIRSYNATSDLLASLETVELRGEDGTVEVHRVVRATPHGRGTWLVALEDVTDRTAASTLAHRHVVVPPEALPPLDDDEFYHHELLGFSVETTTGAPLGTIAGTLSTGLNDVWVVRDGRRELLVPVIADVVRLIDRTARRVVVVPLDGLLD
jgi:16S rRNA processing protein RimM